MVGNSLGSALRAFGLTALIGLIAGVGMTAAGYGTSSAFAAGPAKTGSGAADKAFAAGVKAMQAGKSAQAVEQFTTAISGGLGTSEMARALYLRGLAYRKTGQSALAIADLSNALYLKTGLSADELKEAESARTAAYAEAGLSAPAVVPKPRATSLAKAAPIAPRPVPTPPAPPPAVAKTSAPQPAITGWKTATKPVQAPAQAITASERASPPAANGTPPSQTAAVAPPRRPASTQAAAATPEPAQGQVARPTSGSVAEPPSSGGSGIGGFFQSIFGDLSLGPPSPPAPPAPQAVTTSSIGRPDAAVSAWSNETSIAPSGASRAIASAPPPKSVPARAPRVAAVVAPAPVPEAVKPDGKYRLFVASAKSRQEAIKIATRLKAKHRRAISKQQIAIDQETGAANKPVYTIKLGPFASANEPRNLCVKLRQSGYECRLLTP